jgi:hypothetical protein
MDDAWYRFLEDIRVARQSLGNPQIVWYRGHSSDRYALVPSLHRQESGLSKEQAIFSEFERTAARLFEKREDDWQTLCDMQHYGLPTRLLDWTEALGVAIAFAVLDRFETDDNAAVFVLDPAALNRASGLDGIKRIPRTGFEYKAVYWHNQPFAAHYPIAIAPTFKNERMIAQRGAFTVHGQDSSPVEELCPSAIRKVPLPGSALAGAREFLEYADFTSYTIYPDIVGMARHIRKKYLGS